MDASLALTALLMGLAGGPHCVAMCGAVCGALGRPVSGIEAGPRSSGQVIARVPATSQAAASAPLPPTSAGISQGQWLFQIGRLLSYGLLGTVAAASMQTLGWLTVHAAVLKPVWTLVHVAAAMLGLVLLWQARQPLWLEEGARRLWQGLQAALARRGRGSAQASPLVLGLAWGFMPCGLLYSALLVAALSPAPWQGGAVMLLFAWGSSLSLVAGPWLWRRMRGAQSGAWAVRVAGAALLGLSVWALWMGLVHDTAPWCVTPAPALS